jgi:hypothetical protein
MARELIEPHKGDKRYVRRAKGGQFKESDDVGRSLAADQRTEAAASHGFAIILTDTGDRGSVRIAVSPAVASLSEYRARASVREQSKEQKTAEFEVESFRESLGTP